MKQYLLICEEAGMKALEALIKGLQFIEVQGMDVGNNNVYKLLVTPVIPPVAPIDKPMVNQETCAPCTEDDPEAPKEPSV